MKTAYEVRISDWSSDVCSSDLVFDQRDAAVAIAVHAREVIAGAVDLRVRGERQERRQDKGRQEFHRRIVVVPLALAPPPAKAGGGWVGVDRKSVVQGKSVSVRVDLGGRLSIHTKTAVIQRSTHQ